MCRRLIVLQEIQEKIGAQSFKDCKVRVSNVDAQASIGNGIVIQVLGEMSNNGLPNRKFSQTFFLAEQPNGYYVLNDIFRYLKDDDDIEEGDEYAEYSEGAAESTGEPAEETLAQEISEELKDMSVKETNTVEVDVSGETVRMEETTTTTLEPEAVEAIVDEVLAVNGETIETNGSPAPEEEEEAQPEEVAAPVEAEVEAEPKVEEPVAEIPAEKPATPAPAVVEEPKRAPVAAPAAAPVPAGPPVRKTWASLVATSASTAPPAPVAHAAPVSAPAAAAPTQQAAAPQTTSAPAAAAPAANAPNAAASSGSWQTADNKRHSRVASSIPAGQTLGYVKNVSEAVTEEALKEALSKFGPLKHFEVVRPRVCNRFPCLQ